MPALFTNNATTTLSAGIGTGDTSISVAASTGSLFPAPTGSEYFYATIVDSSNNLEIVKCTARSADTLTVTRAQEGTSAQAFSSGDRIELRPTAAGLNNMVQLDDAPVFTADVSVPDEAYNATTWNGSVEVPTKNAVRDKIDAMDTTITALGTDKMDKAGGTFTGDISVPAEAYGTGWNGSNEVPTKNDIYDKVVTLKASAPSIQSVTSSATVTPTFSDDQVNITAQAAGLTLANPTGTAVPAWGIVIRIKDNGTARAISYDTQYRAIGVTLPTTTVVNKTLYLGMIYNSTDTKWDVVAVAQEA